MAVLDLNPLMAASTAGRSGVDAVERDLGDERVTEGRFKKLAQEMALCNAMIGLGKAGQPVRRQVAPPNIAAAAPG